MLELEQILVTAIDNKASDIHMTVAVPPIVRVNGRLLHVGESLLTPEDTLRFAKEILGERLFEIYRESGECDAAYSYRHGNRHSHFRVNVFNQKNHCGIVMRLIPPKVPTIEELNLPDVFRMLSTKRRGLILVTGPTGSGKTTTLAAMIEYMSRTRNEHIITIEDPIEYVFAHGIGIVNQRQLGSDTKSFAAALRSALREDPDIIMVGEMRDLETISAAITAAETGHLVLATLHTIGAAKTIDRIIDVFPPEQQAQIRTQLGSVLEAVISQQLCPNRQNNGRQLALEIMLANHAILNLIREGKTTQVTNMMQLNSGEGMVTMDQSLLTLFRKGRIDEQTLLKFCVDVNEVRRLIGA
jgi:twitching motility protein PilT